MKYLNSKTFLRSMGMVSIFLKKNGPRIAQIAGTIGTIAGTVMACDSTTNLDPIIAEHIRRMDDIHRVQDAVETGTYTKVSREEIVAWKAQAMRDTSWKLVKLYAKPAVTMLGSLTAMNWAFFEMEARFHKATALYMGLLQTFQKYRDQTREALGESEDRRMITEAVKDVQYPTSFVFTYDPTTSSLWSNRFVYNTAHVDAMLGALDDTLIFKKGYLYLDEVLEGVGFDKLPMRPEYHQIGWVHPGNGKVPLSLLSKYVKVEPDPMNSRIVLHIDVQGDISTLAYEKWGDTHA